MNVNAYSDGTKRRTKTRASILFSARQATYSFSHQKTLTFVLYKISISRKQTNVVSEKLGIFESINSLQQINFLSLNKSQPWDFLLDAS